MSNWPGHYRYRDDGFRIVPTGTTKSGSPSYNYHSYGSIDRAYYLTPEWAEPWRQVRKDSDDAVKGITEGIHASPYRAPDGGHIGDPGDRSNYLDEPWEMAAVMAYKNRTGWYSDDARAKRSQDKMFSEQQAEWDKRLAAAAEAARKQAREDYITEQQSMTAAPLIQTQPSGPQPVPGIESSMPPWYGQQAPEWWGQRQPPPQWTTGNRYYNPQGVRSGQMDYINNRRGPQWYFGRGGERLQLDNLNL